MSAPEPASAETPAPKGHGAMLGRLAMAHFLCYPLMFWAAVTGMSIPILTSEDALLAAAAQTEASTDFQRWLMRELALGAAEAASFEVVMKPLAVLLLLLFVGLHVASVPWALGARRSVRLSEPAHERRGRKIFLWAAAVAILSITLVGAIGWLRILLM